MFMLPHKIAIVLILLFMAVMVRADDATFSWIPNSEPDLAGYVIHCGTAPRDYTFSIDTGLPDTVDGRVFYTVQDIPAGVYYCAATARDVGGNVSDFSNEVSTDSFPGPVLEFMVEIKISATVTQ